MSLTGGFLFSTVVVLALAAMAATLCWWGRLRGPRAARWLTRLMMIGTCQLTAVVLVAVWINDSNGLYTSWADLFGVQSRPAVAEGASLRQVDFQPTADGMLTVDYHGAESGLDGQVLVWVPPQYHQAAYRNYRFPVIMLLHGIPGSPRVWVDGGGAPGRMAAMMAQGLLKPAVLVIPQIDPDSTNTDCANAPDGAQDATWLAHDVPQLLKSRFRVLDRATGWGVVGISTGGYCAAKLALQYPQTFAAAVALSPDDFGGDPDVLTSQALRQENDPVFLAAAGAPVSILIATSGDDRFSTPANAEALYLAAKWPTVVAEPLILAGGGHNWGTWHAMYPTIFSWLSAHLAAPRWDATIPAEPDPERLAGPELTGRESYGVGGGTLAGWRGTAPSFAHH